MSALVAVLPRTMELDAFTVPSLKMPPPRVAVLPVTVEPNRLVVLPPPLMRPLRPLPPVMVRLVSRTWPRRRRTP